MGQSATEKEEEEREESECPSARRASQEEDFQHLLQQLHLDQPARTRAREDSGEGGMGTREIELSRMEASASQGSHLLRASFTHACPSQGVGGNQALPQDAGAKGARVAERGSRGRVATRSQDPLLWFGVLTSPALRRSQSKFRDALPIVARMADAKSQLLAEVERVERLKARLKELSA